jgi:hypothetical protein
MHFSYNFAGGHIAGLLGLVPGTVLYVASGGLVFPAILAVVVFGPKHLSRRHVSELPIYSNEAADLAPSVSLSGTRSPA